MRIQPPFHRRGFTTMIAVFMMIFVTMTIFALSQWFANDAMRTKRVDTGVQLRQLLVAGQIHTQDLLSNNPDELPATPVTIDLPKRVKLIDGTLTTRYESQADGKTCVVMIDAQYRKHLGQQILTYSRQNGHWQLIDIELVKGHVAY